MSVSLSWYALLPMPLGILLYIIVILCQEFRTPDYIKRHLLKHGILYVFKNGGEFLSI